MKNVFAIYISCVCMCVYVCVSVCVWFLQGVQGLGLN